MTGKLSMTLNETAVRKAITPMVDDFIASLRLSALKRGEERYAIQGRCEARFRSRLDAFAGENGIFGQYRASLNVIVDTILNERATVALETIGREPSRPRRRGLGGWLMAALGAARPATRCLYGRA